ncbi:bifunctional diguanylate cyclase/phosphodiesterase [Bacillus sp. B-jedd]|uniref:bifunctional diguanylate cyclase/phosphodiesterase n=1 Tax=Bacillus sp. B-jedd TaxID=1476857 RepID=UPI000515633C|nr:EAL domain-containing protein [Bacillus sp. B-jedd]CEG25934.1 PAS/PAC sensor-containing diguanylate cyclase/phosphodiesterase [Bacillus sp. B-jedd]
MKIYSEPASLLGIYRSLFDNNHDACYALDLEGNFMLFNQAAVEITGYSQEEALKMSFVSIIYDDFLNEAVNCFHSVVLGNYEKLNIPIKNKNGKRVELIVTAGPIYINGQINGIIGMAKDLTEKAALEMQLSNQNQVLEMVAKGSPMKDVLDNIIFLIESSSNDIICSILVPDKEGENLLLKSGPNLPTEYKKYLTIFPIGPKEGSGGTAAYYKRPVITKDIDKDLLWKKYKLIALASGLKACWSYPIFDINNEVIGIFEMYYKKLHNPEEPAREIIEKAIYLTSIVLQHYRSEEKINFMAFHDELTGLANRRLFKERLNTTLNAGFNPGKVMAVMYFDLDQFKLINDSLGHTFGDKLLKAVAKRLQSSIRQDDLVSRWGGDEFTILLMNIKEREIKIVAQRILNVFEKSFSVEGKELFITPGIGISLYPYDGVTTEELLRKADIAMYQAKKEGRNNYQFYNDKLDKQSIERLEIENQLRKALERNEFTLEYQPIIELSTEKLTGVEALIRWKSPVLGQLSPNSFIPVAEETGMILPIGEWVLKTACQQMKNWLDNGIGLSTISVNISLRQFYQPDLVPMISEVIKETGIHPSNLTIEITESMTMDVTIAKNILQDLKSIGVNISIDDFGTGYSSLSYLKRFPIDFLKIDQSFIRDIANSKDDENIATTILLMGRNLGLNVIAEGVETKEQLSILRSNQCHEAQGYLFSRPLSPEKLEQLFTAFHMRKI